MKQSFNPMAAAGIPPAAVAAAARAHAQRAPLDPDDRDAVFRATAAELAKMGISIDGSAKDRQSLISDRNSFRKAVNALADRSLEATKAGDSREADRLDIIVGELGRIVGKIDRQIDAQELINGSKEGASIASGSKLRVLAKGDRFATGQPAGFGFGEYVKAMVTGTGDHNIRAALSEGTDSAGGYTVPKFLMGQVIDRMRAKTAVIQAGALTIPLETQTTTIARIASDPTAGWRLEAGAIAESDPTFDAVTFTARSLAVLVKISRELLDDSANIDQALTMAFAGAMAGELDRVAMFGSGTAPEPRGIFNQTSANSVSMGTNGAQITSYAKLLDSLYELQLDNSDAPSGMIMHPRTARTLNGLTDTTNQPLMIPPALSGIPQLITTSVPITQTQGTSGAVCSTVLMGDFSQLLIGVRQEMRIEVLRELFAGNHQYAFVCHLRADIAVAHPESFCKLIGILP